MKRSIAFLLQTNYIDRVTAPVGFFAQSAGYDIVDRTCNAEFNVMNCGVDWSQYEMVVPYGSVQFIRYFENSPLAHYIKSDPDGFSAQAWMEIFGELALNHGGLEMKAGDVHDYLVAHESAHVRPTSVDKAIIAKLYSADTWLAHSAERFIPEDLDVFVSAPKVIEREYRCWVVAGKVVEARQYMVKGNIEVGAVDESAVYEAAQALADVYVPSDAVVLDMASTPEGFKFLEFNRFHSSGWYGNTAFKVMGAYVAMLEQKLAAEAEKRKFRAEPSAPSR